MSRSDPKTYLDGFALISGGVDSQPPAQLLAKTELAWGANISLRQNVPTTRPGFTQRALIFIGNDGQPSDDLQASFEDGVFQGAVGFVRADQLIASIGGKLWKIDPDRWYVTEVTPTKDNGSGGFDPIPVNGTLYRAWFAEAEDFLIRQDGQTAAWIYDGSTTREADAAGISGVKEIPGGTAMVYSQARLDVAAPDGRTFTVGDIVNGPSGSPRFAFRDAVLKFTENDLINLGGAFTIPINAGPINALLPVAQVDTSLGQGPTQIFCDSGIFSLNTPTDRAQWKTVNYPIQTFSVVQVGATSDRATVNINGDIWFRAPDGIRSFQVARRDWGSWTNSPQSLEVERALRLDDRTLLGYASAAYFDNRLLMTTRPYRVFDHGVAHQGLVALDFSPVSTLGSQSKPIWEGVWSGLNFLQILSCKLGGVDRCFAFSLNLENKIELWELTRDGDGDRPSGRDAVPIEGFIETCGFTFPDYGFDRKRLAKAWFWPEDVRGSCEVAFQWKANGGVNWNTWHDFTLCATVESCNTEECLGPVNLRSQMRRPYLLPSPNPVCDLSSDAPSDIGEYFQVRISFAGHMRLARLLVSCSDVDQIENEICPSSESCRIGAISNCQRSEDGFNFTIYR